MRKVLCDSYFCFTAWLIKWPLFVPGPDRASHSRQFLLAARFLDPEDQEAVEALIQDLGLEFMGAEV